MKKKILNKVISLSLVGAVTLSLASCGKKSEGGSTKKTADGKTVVQVVFPPNNVPLAYEDEDGNYTGYEVEVLKLVDEALEDYVFEYNTAAQDAAFTGLSSGKYNLAITNSFYTDERAKNYNIPDNQIGASPVGIVVANENADKVSDLKTASEQGVVGAPQMAGDGLTYQLELWNKNNPDNQVEFEYTDNPNAFTDSIGFVAEGRYGFTIYPKTYYEVLVTAEDGSLHEYADKLTFNLYSPVPTYPIIEKGNDELTKAVSDELGKLKEDGTLEKLSEEFYGFNAFTVE